MHLLTPRFRRQSCILHAHLAYLYLHTPEMELNSHIVTTMLTAQMFLTAHYDYQLGVRLRDLVLLPLHSGRRVVSVCSTKTKLRRTGKETVETRLGVPDTELFDLFHKQRSPTLAWLQAHPRKANRVMEAMICLVAKGEPRSTMRRRRQREAFAKAQVSRVRPSEVVLRPMLATGESQGASCPCHCCRTRPTNLWLRQRRITSEHECVDWWRCCLCRNWRNRCSVAQNSGCR